MSAEVILEHFENTPLNAAAEPVWSYRHSYKRTHGSFYRQIILFGDGEEGYQERRLTPREFRILRLICNGVYNREIASLLRIDYQTVKSHITNIRDHLGISKPDEGGEIRNLILWSVFENGFLRFEPRIPEESWVGII